MAEPQNLKAIRDTLEDIGQKIANAGIDKSAMLIPGAVVGICTAVRLTIQHIESLEERIRNLEAKP